MTNGDIDGRLDSIEQRLEKVENHKKDLWDKVGILASILIPAAIAAAGFYVSAAIKDAEISSAFLHKEAEITAAEARSDAQIKSAEEIAEGNRKVAEINALVAQAKLIHSFMESLTKEDAQEKTVAIEAMSLPLPEELVERLLVAVKEDDSLTQPVREAAEKILSKLRTGAACSSNSECISNYCYPVPPGNTKTGKACLAKQYNCAFADSQGYKYGQWVIVYGQKYTCYRPPSGPANWIANNLP